MMLPMASKQSKQKAIAVANDAKLEGKNCLARGSLKMHYQNMSLLLQLAPPDMGKYEDAIKECAKAIELNPNYVKALFRRGKAHKKLEHFEEAIADMKKKFLEVGELNVQAKRTIGLLEPLANAKREKMEEEMIDPAFFRQIGSWMDSFHNHGAFGVIVAEVCR